MKRVVKNYIPMDFQNNDRNLREILENTRTIALVGASNVRFPCLNMRKSHFVPPHILCQKTDRPSYEVMEILLSYGYEVIPVNPLLAGSKIFGKNVFATLTEVPMVVDMVDIFRYDVKFHAMKGSHLRFERRPY